MFDLFWLFKQPAVSVNLTLVWKVKIFDGFPYVFINTLFTMNELLIVVEIFKSERSLKTIAINKMNCSFLSGQSSLSMSIHRGLFFMPAHKATQIQKIQARASNTFLWQEAIDQDVGHPPIGGVFNAGVSRLSLWDLHLVLSASFITHNQFCLWCGCGRSRCALMATLHQPQRRCTEKLQPLMSDKDVDAVRLLDHQEQFG